MDHKIEVFLGPYFYTNWLIAAMYTDRFNPTHHYLLMENEVYDVLTIDERYCVIAHEVGHLVIENSLPRRYKYPFNIYVSYEIKADNFAVSYMGTDIMESTLKKIFNYKPNYRARMLNVNMLKLQGK
jgi:hypothetical protein